MTPPPRQPDKTPEQKARDLALWANRALADVQARRGIGKLKAVALAEAGYNTVERILNGNLTYGPPRQATVLDIAQAWGADPAPAYVAMGWPLVEAPAGERAEERAERMEPETAALDRVLTAPDRVVPPKLKAWLRRRLRNVFAEYQDEARESGLPVVEWAEESDVDGAV